MKNKKTISIIGCGNIGSAIANGLVSTGYKPSQIYLTKRKAKDLEEYKSKGFNTATDNKIAVAKSEIIILAVTPQQLNVVLDDIKSAINIKKHIIMSVVSGASIKQIKNNIGMEVPVVRVMPNTAIAIQESMTCICADERDASSVELAKQIFDSVGKTIQINEDLMGAATALCACGTAFFLRAVRAASQGGIEIGFHSHEALVMAAQTAKGAATMLLKEGKHPEREIDKVTTPQGITISGLNQMEHNGFSSSMIKGIVTAAEKAQKIYSNKD
ncbi:MAG: pyrroline-5-carboxylate reductase [Ignavibacteriales bacterium]|nr:pyrroline-5-carboxylate reductase [Ignavibacteriota bacterium]MCB0748224.1 pyrroline-5-carboxylate reductase [Ignavibacteriota bacterium]MCB9248958.1 pyrroline-5-carboxylate reductase [Ignavibacteriales bacterium]